MAVEIIQKGARPTVKCSGCHSILAFSRTDTFSTEYGKYTRKIICPVCGFDIYIDMREAIYNI